MIDAAGNFSDASGSSRGISTVSDKELLLALRKHADAVIVDAATARKERYRALSNKLLIILSKSGDFRDIPAAHTGTEVILASASEIVTDSQVSGRHSSHLLPAGNPFLELRPWLSGLGIQKAVLETGVTMSKLAFAASAVDRAALTITKHVASSGSMELRHPLWPDSELVSLAEDDSATFSLWQSGGVAANQH